MALYKVGDRYLSEEEYQSHCEDNWVFGLFVAGVIAAGFAISQVMPEEWPKFLRFIAVIASSFVGGGVLSLLAVYIRKAVFLALGAGLVMAVCYGVYAVL